MTQGWGQCGTITWTEDGTGGAQQCGGVGFSFTAKGDNAYSSIINNPQTLSFDKKRSGNSTAWRLLVQISPAGGATNSWTTIATITSISSSCGANPNIDLSSYTGQRRIRFIDDRSSGAHERGVSNIEITCNNAVNRTVTFNGNGHTGGTMASQTANTATNLTNNAFTKTGYAFAGWATSGPNAAGGLVAHANQASYPFTDNATLHAVWRFTVAYNNNGGTGTISNQSDFYDNATGEGTRLLSMGAAFSRPGYTFGGWKTTSGDAGTATYPAGGTYTHSGSSSTVTMYAHWVASGSTLVASPTTLSGFNYVEGSGPSSYQTFNLTGINLDGSDVELLPGEGYEISIDNGATYVDFDNGPAVLPAYSGSSQTIRVRLKAGLTAGTYNDVILIEGGGDTDGTEVTVNGSVSACVAPTIQTTINSFSGVGLNAMTVNFTATAGDGRIVIMNTTNSFTNPTNATTLPTANTVYSGSGQQVVYAGTGSAVSVTGLNPSTTYWFRVYNYNNCSGTYTYNTATASNNPRSQATLCQTPVNPNGEITAAENPSCGPTTLVYEHGTSQPESGVTYYWQTSVTGTSQAFPVTSAYSVSTTGHYYVRAYNGSCWSTSSYQTSSQIVINSLPSITSQPANQSVTVGATATFTVSATGTAPITYQWQRKIGAGSWTNITPNGTSASYTTPATTLAMNNYQYRVIVTNNCSNVISAIRTLTVIDGPCLEEAFSSAIGYTTGTVNLNSGIWDFNDALIQNQSGNFEAQLRSATGTYISSPATSGGVESVTFKAYRTSGSGSALQVRYSTDNGNSWTTTSDSPFSLDTSKSEYTSTINTTVPTMILFYRTAGTVRIDDIEIFCGTPCTPVSITATPNSGPSGTVVTLNGSGFTAATTVQFGTVSAASIEFVSATQIKAVVPAGATTGPIVVTTDGCDSETTFTVITPNGSACDGALSIPNVPQGQGDLIFYEVFDTSTNNSGLITLFNASYQDLNLSDYQISRHGGESGDVEVTAWHLPTGILAPGEVYVFSAGSAGQCGSYPSFDGGTPNITGLNDKDRLRIVRASNLSIVDEVTTPNQSGYYLRRTHYAVNTTHNSSDWSTTLSGGCRSGMGVSPILATTPIQPVITSQPIVNYTSCNAAQMSVTATVSNAGTPNLNYQWFVNVAGSNTWTSIVEAAPYSGTTTATLTINSLAGLEGNQYYVQVRQGAVVCQVPSFANQLSIPSSVTIWNGSNWSAGIPDATTAVRLQASYNTNTANLTACSLDLNGHTLTINADQHATIQNEIVGAGMIDVKNDGSLIQVNDAAVNGTQWDLKMERITQPKFRYDFTYWGSPVTEASGFKLSGDLVMSLSPITLFDKHFKWNHSAPTQAWQTIFYGNEAMVPGRGYIVRAPQNFDVEGSSGALAKAYTATFMGKSNNGIITHAVTGDAVEQKWNLLSNPYPSAINIETFLRDNQTLLDGTVYLWTHNTRPIPTAEGSPVYSYSPSDYATYNFAGAVATRASSDDNPLEDTTLNENIPTEFLAAGQAFFVRGVSSGAARFSNALRGGANDNFFRPAPTTPIDNWDMVGKHRIWLNLTGNDAFNQTMVGYIEHATNGLDWGYDGLLFGGNKVSLYSVQDATKLTIQGRALPFNNQDVVPLGYESTQNGELKIALDHVDGMMVGQAIYLEDKVLQIVHDLKQSAYAFTTTIGTFDDRFVLRFTNETLGNGHHDALLNEVLVFRNEGVLGVQSETEAIEAITVYDILGRIILEEKNLNQTRFTTDVLTAYNQVIVVNVKLESGAVVSRKVVY